MIKRRHTVQDTTTWRAEIVIWLAAARAKGVLRGPAIGRVERPAGRKTRDRWWVRPVWTRQGGSRSCPSPPGPS